MGGQPWPDLSSWKAAMGSSPERGRRGKEERESAAGGLSLLLLCLWSAPAFCSVAAAGLLDVRRISRAEERKGKKRERKEKRKKEKERKNRKIAKLENFREEK
jgi:hypothetical protein